MDTQQMLQHVSRHDPPSKNEEGEKKKKTIQLLHMNRAVYVACLLLAHKARFIGAEIFDQIHTIRKAGVSEALEAYLMMGLSGL